MSTDSSTTSVVVSAGWAVYLDGQQHHDGAELDVDPDTAAQWLAAGWAEPASPRRRTTAGTDS
jgi:hypothetical protein